jgi:hypothetical protein
MYGIYIVFANMNKVFSQEQTWWYNCIETGTREKGGFFKLYSVGNRIAGKEEIWIRLDINEW